MGAPGADIQAAPGDIHHMEFAAARLNDRAADHIPRTQGKCAVPVSPSK